VGRYLKASRPSGSGTDDFVVVPEYKHLKWLFPHIKTRASCDNLRQLTSPPPSNSSSVPDESDDGQNSQGKIDKYEWQMNNNGKVLLYYHKIYHTLIAPDAEYQEKSPATSSQQPKESQSTPTSLISAGEGKNVVKF
jgi:hypothetical protein